MASEILDIATFEELWYAATQVSCAKLGLYWYKLQVISNSLLVYVPKKKSKI